MDDVSRDRKQAYLKKVFRNCGNGEIAEQISLLEAFFSAEGSVQAISQALFIHKNTVQYRIKRLAELTGWMYANPVRPRRCTSPCSSIWSSAAARKGALSDRTCYP